MKTKKLFYIVIMYRYGDNDSYSYILGLFTNFEKAILEAEKDKQYRGNKYEPTIYEIEPNVMSSRRKVYGV
jgi:hypothetical protein